MTNPVFKDPPVKYTATARSLLVHVRLLTMTCRLGTESERLQSLFFLASVCTLCLCLLVFLNHTWGQIRGRKNARKGQKHRASITPEGNIFINPLFHLTLILGVLMCKWPSALCEQRVSGWLPNSHVCPAVFASLMDNLSCVSMHVSNTGVALNSGAASLVVDCEILE